MTRLAARGLTSALAGLLAVAALSCRPPPSGALNLVVGNSDPDVRLVTITEPNASYTVAIPAASKTVVQVTTLNGIVVGVLDSGCLVIEAALTIRAVDTDDALAVVIEDGTAIQIPVEELSPFAMVPPAQFHCDP